jgi:hypothetical protein
VDAFSGCKIGGYVMATPSDWAQFLGAIRAQESGGNYTEDVAGCLGAYCWNAQGNWDTMAQSAGESQYVGVNPSQVPGAVQDKVAGTNLYRIYQQAGGGTAGLSAAARWWNGGTTSSVPNPGLPAQPWAPACGGGSSGAYACQVLTRMRLGGHYVAGGGSGATQVGGSGAGGTVTLTAAQAATCAFGISQNFSLPIPLIGGSVPLGQVNLCFVTKTEVRALYGAGLLIGGTILTIVGLAFLAYVSAVPAVTRVVVAPIMGAVNKVSPKKVPTGQAPAAPAPAPAAAAQDASL